MLRYEHSSFYFSYVRFLLIHIIFDILLKFIAFHHQKKNLMNQKRQTRHTSHQHKSFILKKQESLSTNQSTNIRSKSFISKTYPVNNIKTLPLQKQLQSNSIPLEAMFDNKIKTTYLKKVIDNFFTANNPEEKVFTRSTADKHRRDISKLAMFKHRKINTAKVQLAQRCKQIAFKKPLTPFFESSQQNMSLPIIQQKKYVEAHDERTSPIFDNESWSNFDSSSVVSSRRPISEYKPKKNFFISEDKLGGTISINFEDNSPREKQKVSWKKSGFNTHFQTYNIYTDQILTQKAKIYHSLEDELLKREIKIKKKGVQTLWNFDNNQRILKSPIIKSLKSQLKYEIKYSSGIQTTVKIFLRPYFKELFHNNDEQIKDIMRAVCQLIIKNQGKIINSCIKLDNLYKLDEKKYIFGQWGHSGISEDFKIRGLTIDNFTPPFLYSQNKWQVQPEYLSPELINSVIQNNYNWIKANPQLVKTSQIWSLGCMMIELITLIPLNQNNRSWINGNQEIMRKGWLSVGFNGKQLDSQTLLRKQKGLKSTIRKIFQTESHRLGINKNIIESILLMVEYRPESRITVRRILQIINKL